MNLTFVLASSSPRRRQFMELLNAPFVIIPPTGVDETPLFNEHPADLVQRLSRIKAQAVLGHLDSYLPLPIVVAADTVVVLNQEILGKPANPNEAKRMLQALRVEPHFVYTGLSVALAHHTAQALGIENSDKLITRYHQSTVTMRHYTDTEIDAYVTSGDPLDKAGAYGIQHETFSPVDSLAGCFASVMGFPIAEFAQILTELNIELPALGPLCHKFTGQACCQP